MVLFLFPLLLMKWSIIQVFSFVKAAVESYLLNCLPLKKIESDKLLV
jgi:hypothetical protein